MLVVLSAGGVPLAGDALRDLPNAAVTWVRVETEGRAACLAARVRHGDPPPEFGVRVRRWAAARGWSATVAPCSPTC